jgi:endonuclease/exonuclease/phosphatase family metal-dependent hydrolase
MRIRLATLNVWALPEPISRDPQARIDAIGERLPALGLDLIAFQEVWTGDAADRLLAAGRRAGLVHGWAGNSRIGTGGLLVLSRLPIEDVRFEAFAVTGAPEKAAANLEYLSGKGFVTVRLSTPDGPLLVVATHLHARYGSSAPHRHVPHRTGQAVQLSARFARRREPMVVMGDFNFREGETDYRVLTQILGLQDVAARLDKRQNTTLHTNPYRNPEAIDRRKDFVFVRNGAEQRLVPADIRRSFDGILEIDGRPASYSNHAGLVVDLDVQRVPATAQGLPSVSAGPPRDDVFDAAAHMLQQGEELALARQDGSRTVSAVGLGIAGAAALGAIPKRMNRRRLLRASLAAGALSVLAPSLGFRVASEILVPDEIRAFREASRQLAALRPGGRLDGQLADTRPPA